MEHLRRYTHLSAALHILKTKQITLLDYKKWDDKNDIYYMNEYRKRKHCTSLIALCFSHGIEKFHMWKSFAEPPDGVCINFDFERISEKVKNKNLIFRKMEYKTFDYFESYQDIRVDDIPFLKRIAFMDEEEYRIISSGRGFIPVHTSIQIDASDVRSISLNPWTPLPLVETVRSIIHGVKDFEHLDVKKSTILNSKKWKNNINLQA